MDNMKDEEKALLLKDLCSRLPYGVICRMSGGGFETIEEDKLTAIGLFQFVEEGLECVPYLRPMSSMTEEERKMVCTMNALSEAELDDRIKYRKMYVNSYTIETFDLFNSNHLDYRGLIPMGFAIKVTEENNPYKE